MIENLNFIRALFNIPSRSCKSEFPTLSLYALKQYARSLMIMNVRSTSKTIKALCFVSLKAEPLEDIDGEIGR